MYSKIKIEQEADVSQILGNWDTSGGNLRGFPLRPLCFTKFWNAPQEAKLAKKPEKLVPGLENIVAGLVKLRLVKICRRFASLLVVSTSFGYFQPDYRALQRRFGPRKI